MLTEVANTRPTRVRARRSLCELSASLARHTFRETPRPTARQLPRGTPPSGSQVAPRMLNPQALTTRPAHQYKTQQTRL